jgi:hypothetical protein
MLYHYDITIYKYTEVKKNKKITSTFFKEINAMIYAVYMVHTARLHYSSHYIIIRHFQKSKIKFKWKAPHYGDIYNIQL